MFYNLIESGKQFLCNFLLYNIFSGAKVHIFLISWNQNLNKYIKKLYNFVLSFNCVNFAP